MRQINSRTIIVKHSLILSSYCFWLGEGADAAYDMLVENGSTILRVL